MLEELKIVSIVVTFNGEKWIDRCFGSLTSSQISNHTILAIDNNSNDNTANLLKSNFPNVILIETGENLGFGKANNIGLKWALENNADHIFLLNQDAWVSNETLKSLIQISLNNPVYGILSPIHMNDEKTIDSEFLKYCYLNLKTEFTFDSLLKKPFKSIYETEFINAAAWLITKECLQNNGGFMPIFPHYGEDGNYCERVINSGLKIGFTPGLTVIHDRDVKARKLSYGKKFNRLYIFLLGVFTSINATDISSSFKYCRNGIFNSIKIYSKYPLVLLSLPIALSKIVINFKHIQRQRRQSKNHYPNFLDFS